MELQFSKMHGLGNDFVVMADLAEEIDLSPEAVVWLCDRHFGIGGDGVILVRPASVPDADYRMLYFNSDGSLAEMCGNGVRCFAKYVVDHGLVEADCDSLRVETLGGVKPISVERDDAGLMALATVDMGEPVLSAAEIPTTLSATREDGVVVDAPLETSAGPIAVTCVSMGNPHCVTWVPDVASAPVHTLGPEIELSPAFPRKTNVEFAEKVSSDLIRLRVWERGCGETLACGTGACATVVAGALTGRIAREVTVELPGGDLEIRWSAEDNHVYMTGPAREVFCGVLSLEEEDEDESGHEHHEHDHSHSHAHTATEEPA